MNRSPDDIFAAQFWCWPDPAMKRDPHGRVLFVNAAFLQLFGGTVEDWRGQVLQGWNPPPSDYGPTRFEIRTPATEHLGEQVYDWIEQTGRDGNAFALARNVTAFVAQPAPLQQTPAQNTHPQAQTDPYAHASQTNMGQTDMEQANMATAPVAETAAPLDPAAYVAAAVADSAYDLPQADAQPAVVAPMVEDIPVAPPIQAAPDPAPQPLHDAVPAYQPDPVHVAPQPVQAHATPPEPSHVEPERDFERRALPIENDEAVLGNNWRDAVIAKAVGQDDAEDDGPSLMRTADSSPGAPAAGGIRILLAEDNAINALLTRTLLEADGHTVETVEDGVLAVEAMKTSSYDMIFMDMRMPNMDGLEATRNIRRLPNVPKDLPIVALTANAFDDDRNACFDSGMNDFMTKPVSAEELSEMVVRWTSESEQRMAS